MRIAWEIIERDKIKAEGRVRELELEVEDLRDQLNVLQQAYDEMEADYQKMADEFDSMPHT